MRSLTSEVYTDGGVLVHHTVHSCSQHGPAIARLTLEWPSNVIPVPKTFTLLAVCCLSQCDAASLYLLALIYCAVCLNFLTFHFTLSLKKPEGFCKLQSNVFEMDITYSSSCMRCASSLTRLPLHHPS